MNSSEWSLSLGCWSGVHVRMHVTLPIMVICALLWASVAGGDVPAIPTDRVLVIILLGLAAVALHVMGHVIAAARRGIENREITLAPWGELHSLHVPSTTEAALHMHFSGIMANAFMCVLTAIMLWLSNDFTIDDLLSPLGTKLLLNGDDHVVTLRWAFWLNYLLILVNLLPAFPFDMHRMVQAAMSLFAPHLDENITYNACVIGGRFFSLVLLISSAFVGHLPTEHLLPGWFVLATLGMVGLFATDVRPLQIPHVNEELSLNSLKPMYYNDLEHDEDDTEETYLRQAEFEAIQEELREDGPFAQWLEERRQAARETRLEREKHEERSADEILARLYEKGMQSITPEERILLERVSARLRRRLKKT
jgi:hypothetical protein